MDFSFLANVVTHEHHSTNKKLIGIKDMLEEKVQKENQLMFYLFNDGTVRRV